MGALVVKRGKSVKSWAMMTAAIVPAALLADLSVVASARADAPAAASTAQVRHFRIAAQDLVAALNEFGRQSGRDILFSTDVAKQKRSGGVDGAMTAEAALHKLLTGTGLTFRATSERTFLVQHAQAQQAPTAQPTEATDQGGNGAEAADKVEKVTVTGTRVKGVKDRFSPVKKITRDQMDIAGQGNVSDVFNTLPQNFGAGVTLDGTGAGATEGAGSASVNLRGLGNEATLILLNGRRLAPGGGIGNFVDISGIPTSAIDRVEVMTDGASAIYGSDAIAGVVNIILRDDFDGAESRLNLSTTTDGGGNVVRAGQTVGFSGQRAHGLVSYQYASEHELDANDRDFSASAVDPTYLLPFNRKHSVFASGGLQLSERIRLSTDGYYNERRTKGFTSTQTSFALSQNFQVVDVQQVGGAAGANAQLFGDWELDLSGTYSQSVQDSDVVQLETANSSGTILNARSSIASADASIGGSLFHITSEPVRAVVGTHHRWEDQLTHVVDRLTMAITNRVDRERDVSAVFGEIYAPLVSEDDEVAGINRLAFTAAARYEDYSDVGSTFDPKVGIAWSPFASLNVRGTFGTSFRAARLSQLIDRTVLLLGVYVDPQSPSGSSTAILLQGSSSDLDPEQAETWTAGFDYTPEWLDGFQLRATYFGIDYRDRLGEPSIGFDAQSRFQDFTGRITRNPSAQTLQDLVDRAELFIDISDFVPSLGDLAVEDVSVILDFREQNLSFSNVEGVDLEAAYHVPAESGDWTFFFNSTILTSYTRQSTPVSPTVDLLDTFGNPVEFRFRAGASWQTTAVNASLFVNYVDAYIDDELPTGAVPIDSWTTADASVRFDLGEMIDGEVMQDVSLVVSVTNMFNTDPPGISPSLLRPAFYDAANADPVGRRVGILLTKQF